MTHKLIKKLSERIETASKPQIIKNNVKDEVKINRLIRKEESQITLNQNIPGCNSNF